MVAPWGRRNNPINRSCLEIVLAPAVLFAFFAFARAGVFGFGMGITSILWRAKRRAGTLCDRSCLPRNQANEASLDCFVRLI